MTMKTVELRRLLEEHLLRTAQDEDGWLSNTNVLGVDKLQAQVELRGYETIDVQHAVSDILQILRDNGVKW